MAKQSKITRERIADNNVFTIGEDYAKSLQPAIEANKRWLDTFPAIKSAALEYSEIQKQFNKSGNQKEFIKAKEKEKEISEQTAIALKEQRNAELNLIKTIERKKIASEGTNRALVQNRVELQQLNRRITETAKLSSALSTEYEKQSIKLIQLQRQYKDVALTKGENSREARKLLAETQKLDATLKRVDANVGQFQRNVGNYGAALNSAGNAARNLASSLGVVAGTALFVRVMRDATNVVRDFEDSNATLGAILQVNKNEMRDLTADAIRLGSVTAKTAGEVSQLQIAYARLGFSQREILDLTADTINGSIALNAELENTAQLTGAVINTFDEFSTTDAAKVLDILSLSTARSALNFQQLEKGLPTVAGAANAAGIPFTRLIALLGKLSDSGIDTSQSATALRNIFIESAGQGLNYQQILDKIANSTDQLTESYDEFGKRAAVSATILAQNIQETEALDEALQNAAGTAEEMANKELDTLSGSLTLLRSAWEGIILQTNEANSISDKLKNTVQFLTRNLQTILRVLAFLITSWILYRTTLATIGLLQNAYLATTRLLTVAKVGLTNGIRAATTQMIAFNVATKANPIGLLIGVLATATAAFFAFGNSVKESVKELEEIKQKAEEARDAIVETNIALVRERLRAIDAQSKSEEDAYQKKLDLLNQEIQDQKSGQRLVSDFYTELNEKRIKDEEETQRKLNASLDKYNAERLLKELKQQQSIINARRGLSEGLSTSGQDGAQPRIDLTPALDESAADRTVKELNALLKQLEESRAESRKRAAEESERDRQARIKKEREDEIALINFINNYKIETLKKVAENEDGMFEVRINALQEASSLELKLLEFNTQKRLEGVKKGSNEERLIIMQAAKERRKIEEDLQKQLIEIESKEMERKANIAKLQKERQLNEELEAENRAFLAREGLYEKEANAVELREKRIAEIKKKYALEALEVQVKAIETLLKSSELSAQKRAEYEKQLSDLKLGLSELVTGEIIEQNQKRVLSEQETAFLIEDLSRQLAFAITDIINNISQARIQRIDDEIRKNDEFYSNLLDNENLTDAERQRLEQAQELRREQLEAKKRQEQRRQAVFNKVLASAEAGVNTALAITKTIANIGMPLAIPFVALTALLGAAQIAAIVSTPVPAYFMGTDDHPGGKALVAEFQPEVIQEPGKKPYVQKTPVIKHFPRHTKVTPSVEEYNALMKASILTSIESSKKKLNDFQTARLFDKNSDEMLEEMKQLNQNIKNKKQPIHFHERKIDFGHEIWRLNNLT